jgi:hypothetical protein
LRRHLTRIDDPRLRRACLAVFSVGPHEFETSPAQSLRPLLRSVQSKRHR